MGPPSGLDGWGSGNAVGSGLAATGVAVVVPVPPFKGAMAPVIPMVEVPVMAMFVPEVSRVPISTKEGLAEAPWAERTL